MENNLIKACRNRDTDLIESILAEMDKDFNTKDDFGNTALHYLCGFGDARLAEKLLDSGGNVAAENSAGETVLHKAAQSGDTALVRLLLGKGADINRQTREGMTPLIYAVRGRNVPAARLLLSFGADRFLRTVNSLSALDFIKAEGLDELLAFFGEDFPVKDTGPNSPIHQAVFEGKLDAVKALLAANPADVNKRNQEGLTPLLIAIIKLNYGVSDLLLASGADPNAVRFDDGFSPLHIAALNGANRLAEILIEHGADIDRPAIDGATPLILAVQAQQRDFIGLVLRHGASAGIADKNGKAANDYAKESQFPEIVHLFNEKKPKRFKKG